jgi:hypothetical protein
MPCKQLAGGCAGTGLVAQRVEARSLLEATSSTKLPTIWTGFNSEEGDISIGRGDENDRFCFYWQGLIHFKETLRWLPAQNCDFGPAPTLTRDSGCIVANEFRHVAHCGYTLVDSS